MKRFWRDVTVDPACGVRLDDKPLRTPGREPLVLPNAVLANAIAQEWRSVEGELDPRAMRLTGLANTAIDRILPHPARFAAGLAAYAESDLLCYRAEGPDDLVKRQTARWNPVLDWANRRYDVHFELVTGVMHRPQPPATIERIAGAIAARQPFELAPLSPIVTITGSLVLALALVEQAFAADSVWAAANLDEDWQAERWGLDALARQARETRRGDFNAAVEFLQCLRDGADR